MTLIIWVNILLNTIDGHIWKNNTRCIFKINVNDLIPGLLHIRIWELLAVILLAPRSLGHTGYDLLSQSISSQNQKDSALVSCGCCNKLPQTKGFPGGSVVKNPPANAGDIVDMGSICGLGASPGEGNSNPTILFIYVFKIFSSCFIYTHTHTHTHTLATKTGGNSLEEVEESNSRSQQSIKQHRHFIWFHFWKFTTDNYHQHVIQILQNTVQRNNLNLRAKVAEITFLMLSLRYNLHTIKFALLWCLIQWFQYIYRVVHSSPLCNF